MAMRRSRYETTGNPLLPQRDSRKLKKKWIDPPRYVLNVGRNGIRRKYKHAMVSTAYERKEILENYRRSLPQYYSTRNC